MILDKILKTKNITKAAFAEKMGIAPQNVNVLFKNPTEQRIRETANVLGVPVSALLGEEVAAHQDDEVCAFVRFRASNNDVVHLHADTWAEFWAIVDEIASSHPRPRKQP